MKKKVKQIFAALLVAVMLVGFAPIATFNVSAASCSADEAINWLWTVNGKSLDYDGAYGAQCVDLIAYYYAKLGATTPGGNANQYSSNALPAGWQRTKGGTPQKGDILVYAGGSGYGHVAIFESDTVTWHQNWSGHYVQRLTGRSYTSLKAGDGSPYWGCIHPNFNNVVDTTAPTISKTSVSCKTDSQFNINAELYDVNGIDHVWLVVYGPSGEKQFSVNANNGSFYYTIYASEYGGQGVYTVHLYAFDYSGNSAKYVYENINVMKDTTAPQITETFVSCISAASFNINATIYDEEGIDHAWIVVYGPGGEYQYSEAVSNGFFYHTIFTANYGGSGNYTVHLYVIDKSGNSSKAVYENILATNAYTVSYNVNGGTGSIASQTKTHGTNLTLTTTKPTGKNFTVTYNANGGTVSSSSKTVSQSFTNWNTAANGSGMAYNAGATYSTNASVTLYAQYANPSIGLLPTPTRSGYAFDGWYTAANGGTKITDSTKVTENTTVYAHWTKNAETKAVVKDVKIEHNATVNYKSTYMLSPEITADKGAKYTVKYSSSNTKVATVDENGKVYAAKKGSATITCTVTDSYENVVTDKCNVNVDYSGAQWFIIIVLFGWIWYI